MPAHDWEVHCFERGALTCGVRAVMSTCGVRVRK